MISKKKLRGRLIDICAGSGLIWEEEDQYFDCLDGILTNTGNAIVAIEKVFSIPDDSRLRTPWRLKDYDNIDTMVDLVHEALQFDMHE